MLCPLPGRPSAPQRSAGPTRPASRAASSKKPGNYFAKEIRLSLTASQALLLSWLPRPPQCSACTFCGTCPPRTFWLVNAPRGPWKPRNLPPGGVSAEVRAGVGAWRLEQNLRYTSHETETLSTSLRRWGCRWSSVSPHFLGNHLSALLPFPLRGSSGRSLRGQPSVPSQLRGLPSCAALVE